MKKKDSAPATKRDLHSLEKRMATKKDLHKVEERMATKEDLQELEKRITNTLTQRFNLIAENLVYDFKGAFKDRLEQHTDDINRLKHHTGLAAA